MLPPSMLLDRITPHRIPSIADAYDDGIRVTLRPLPLPLEDLARSVPVQGPGRFRLDAPLG
jgi:hypothetical protein